MLILITGSSLTGKTKLSQDLLERYKIPYFSIDHLKMGLIRSKCTDLSVYDDNELTRYMWPIIREMIKTVIENKQNLTIEGAYIPKDWYMDFDKYYLDKIKLYCLVMTKSYIENNYDSIIAKKDIIEKRQGDFPSKEELIQDNQKFYEDFRGQNIVLIDKNYLSNCLLY